MITLCGKVINGGVN